jgi:hypothetical protein
VRYRGLLDRIAGQAEREVTSKPTDSGRSGLPS